MDLWDPVEPHLVRRREQQSSGRQFNVSAAFFGQGHGQRPHSQRKLRIDLQLGGARVDRADESLGLASDEAGQSVGQYQRRRSLLLRGSAGRPAMGSAAGFHTVVSKKMI